MLRLPWRSLAASFPLPSLQIPQRPLGELLRIVQRRLEALDLGITRIAFVHHEASTDLLSTSCETGADGGPTGRDGESGSSQPHFEPRALATVPALSRLRDQRRARVLHDLERELDPSTDHSRWLLAQGWRASLTLPLFNHNRLLGFLFLESTRARAFDPRAMAALEPHLELLLLRISNHFSDLASLDGSLGQLLEIAELRDQDTANGAGGQAGWRLCGRSAAQRRAAPGHPAGPRRRGGLGGKPAAGAGRSSIRSAHSSAWVSADEHRGFP